MPRRRAPAAKRATRPVTKPAHRAGVSTAQPTCDARVPPGRTRAYQQDLLERGFDDNEPGLLLSSSSGPTAVAAIPTNHYGAERSRPPMRPETPLNGYLKSARARSGPVNSPEKRYRITPRLSQSLRSAGSLCRTGPAQRRALQGRRGSSAPAGQCRASPRLRTLTLPSTRRRAQERQKLIVADF